MKHRVLALLLAVLLVLTTLPAMAGGAEEGGSFAAELEKKYVDPDRVYSSDVRWWLGEASNTDEALLEEIQALYDGGFRGVELCMQGDSEAPDEIYAYGSEMWAHKWNQIGRAHV